MDWVHFYLIAFSVAVVFSAAVAASVTSTVIFESSGFTFEQGLYLEYIRKEVERSIPPAIALDCVVLFLEYKFLSRLERRREIKKAIDLTISTYIVTFALWLGYTMFHGLSGDYPPMTVAVIWLSLGNMVACGAFFCITAQREKSRNMGP